MTTEDKNYISQEVKELLPAIFTDSTYSNMVADNIIEDDNLRSLMSLNNVLITSHQAFFTHEAMTNIVTTTLQNAKDFYDGKELVNEVNAQ